MNNDMSFPLETFSVDDTERWTRNIENILSLGLGEEYKRYFMFLKKFREHEEKLGESRNLLSVATDVKTNANKKIFMSQNDLLRVSLLNKLCENVDSRTSVIREEIRNLFYLKCVFWGHVINCANNLRNGGVTEIEIDYPSEKIQNAALCLSEVISLVRTPDFLAEIFHL